MGMGTESTATATAGDQPSPLAGGGIMEMLGALFQDPQNAQTIGKAVSQFGNAFAATQKIPPQAKQFIQQAIKGGIQQAQPENQLNPYGGDMMKFISPDMARTVLDEFGIPYGRMRL